MTGDAGNSVIAQRAIQSEQPIMRSRSDDVTIGAKHQNLPVVGKAAASEFDCLHLLSSHRLYWIAPQLLDKHRLLPSAKSTIRFRDLRIDLPGHHHFAGEWPGSA